MRRAGWWKSSIRDVDRTLLGIIALGFCLRMAMFVNGLLEPARFRSPDWVDGYLPLAKNLYEGYIDESSYLFDRGLARPPAYPAFVWLVGGTHHPAFAVAANIVLGLVAIAATYLLTRELLDHRAGLVAAFVVAVDPITLSAGNSTSADAPFTALVLVGLLLCIRLPERHRSIRLSLAGLVFGIAVLMRPIGVLLPLVLLPVLWLRWRRPLKHTMTASLALLLGFALPVVGWTIKNSVTAGVPTVSTVLSKELVLSGAGGAIEEERGELSLSDNEALRDVFGDDVVSDDAGERSRSQFRAALREIVDHPGGMARNLLRGAFRTMLRPGQQGLKENLFGRPDPEDPLLVSSDVDVPAVVSTGIVVLMVALLGLLYAAAGVGLVKLLLERHYRVVALLLVPILYFGFSAPGGAGQGRYRVPSVPYLAALAGMGCVTLFAYLRRAKTDPA